MNTGIHKLAGLLAGDWINVRRDPTMILALIFAAVPGALLWQYRGDVQRFGDQMFEWDQLDIVLVPVAVCLTPVLIGWVIGFLFLEERDDGPLEAISITPVGRRGMFRYRLGAAWLLTTAIALANCLLLLADIGIIQQIVLAVLIGAEAAMIAVLLPMIARNKVEGLAMTKLFNLVAIVPLFALFSSPFKLLAGLIPSFWIGEIAYGDTRVFPISVTLVLAVVIHIAVLIFAMRRNKK